VVTQTLAGYQKRLQLPRIHIVLGGRKRGTVALGWGIHRRRPSEQRLISGRGGRVNNPRRFRHPPKEGCIRRKNQDGKSFLNFYRDPPAHHPKPAWQPYKVAAKKTLFKKGKVPPRALLDRRRYGAAGVRRGGQKGSRQKNISPSMKERQ